MAKQHFKSLLARRAFQALRKGDVDSFVAFRDAGFDVNSIDGSGKSPLIVAIEHGSDRLRRAVLASDPSLDSPSPFVPPPLYFAVERNDIRAVIDLLKAGASADTSFRGQSVLMRSIRAKNDAIAATLVRAGANPNKVDGIGFCQPLVLASANGLEECLRALLKAGADVNAFGGLLPGTVGRVKGRTALMEAADQGNMAIVKGLLRHGADATLVGIEGKSALDLVGKRKERLQIRRLLLAANGAGRHSSRASKASTGPTETLPPNTVVQILKEMTGSMPEPHWRFQEILVFSVISNRAANPATARREYLSRLEAFRRRCSTEQEVFLSEREDSSYCLCLAPWSDKFEVVSRFKPSGVNSGITCSKLNFFLRRLDKMQPFRWMNVQRPLSAANSKILSKPRQPFQRSWLVFLLIWLKSINRFPS